VVDAEVRHRSDVDLCVFGDMLRIVMSSIMRRRSGFICSVIVELLLLDRTNVQSDRTID